MTILSIYRRSADCFI